MKLKKVLSLMHYEQKVALYSFETDEQIFEGEMKLIPHVYANLKVYQLEIDANNKLSLTIEDF